MKELTIEQKAKAYDEAYKKVVIRFGSNVADEIFPELAESDDERIRKELIEFAKSRLAGFPQCERFIAWLKKMREHLKFCETIQVGDRVTRNEDGVLVNMSQLDRIAKPRKKKSESWLEKQGEHVDKIKPKFKVGDWVVTGYGRVNQVIAVDEDGDGFTLDNGTYFNGSWKDEYHLWTIQDAKDGDVLAYRDGQWIFIYKEKIDDNSFSYYTLYSTIHQDLTINDAAFTLLGSTINPATKEQRDFLFQKMKEAGYEWDANKKELKKMEQKPVITIPKFNVEDKVYNIKDGFECTIESIDDTTYYCDTTNFDIKDQDNWKLVEQKPAWSEEDTDMFGSILATLSMCMNNTQIPTDNRKIIKKEYEWFNKLYDRCLPKQEWSEEDEKEVAVLEAYIRSKDWSERHIDRALGIIDELVNKVKSLSSQNNITDEELAQAKKDAYNDALDKIEYHSSEPTFDDGWSAAIGYLKIKKYILK